MLNELYCLAQSLKAAGIEAPPKHPRVTDPGPSSGPCLRLLLDDKGRVTSLHSVTKDEWRGLWTIREGNQNAFPVCRVPIDPDADSWPKTARDLLDRLGQKVRELAEATRSDHELQNVSDLCDRFLEVIRDCEKFHQRLIDLLSDNEIKRLRTDLQKLRAAGKKGFPAIQLAFDVDSKTIYRTSIRGLVEQALPANDRKGAAYRASECAYTGTNGPLQTGPFPAVKLPVLNKAFPLVSMFSEAPCNRRYGLTDSSVVPVAENAVLEMHKALSFIVDAEREGVTWRGVSNGHFEKSREQRDLLIAYVQGRVVLTAPIASLFGSAADSDNRQFEADSSAVCEALDGVARDEPASHLNVFVLRRVSEGQAQVQLSAQPTVAAVIRAARRWQEGGGNIPEVVVPLASKGDGPSFHNPHTPHPDRLVHLTSREWMEYGKRWSPSRGASFSQVLTVMLKDPGWDQAATGLLGLTVGRTWPLMIGLFGTLLRLRPENSPSHGYPLESCRNALLATSALGILLYALDHRKEDYMHEAPFLVGRLLALADVLHREHSLHERKAEQPPPQMIGNALMGVARENPTAAVARLTDRLPFYRAWADRSNDRLAKWAVGRIQATATELERATPSSSANEADRAQLILGYISRLSDSVSEDEHEEESSGGHDG